MILVTGSTGFLGSKFVERLAAAGKSPIRCLVRPGTSTETTDRLREASAGADLEFAQASFNDPEALREAFEGVEVVYHLAASMSGSFGSMVANTVVGSVNLYEASVAARVKRFVLVSSFSVIGAAGVRRGAVIDEQTPLEPYPERRDPYAFSKHRQEVLAWEFSRSHGLPLVVIRPGVIFGPPKDPLGPRIGVDVFGIFLHLGGGARIPLTFVDNCADLIVQSGLVPGLEGEVFCAVDDDLPTSRQLLRRYSRGVKRLWSVRVPYPILKPMSKVNVKWNERSKGHWPALFKPYEVDTLWKGHRYSNEKAKKMLGWTPRVSMADALDQTFASLELEAARGSSANGS